MHDGYERSADLVTEGKKSAFLTLRIDGDSTLICLLPRNYIFESIYPHAVTL